MTIKQILLLATSTILLFLGVIAFLFEIILIYETPHREYQSIFNYTMSVYMALAGGIILSSSGIVSLYIFKIKPISAKPVIFLTISGIMFFLAFPALIMPLKGFYQNPDAMYYSWDTFTGFAYLMIIFGTIVTTIGIISLYKSKFIKSLI